MYEGNKMNKKRIIKVLLGILFIYLLLPYNILILGSDERQNIKGARSDGIIVVKVVPLLFKVKVLSIPRDTYAYIPCKNKYDKINHAFSYGKAKCSMKAVSGLLKTRISNYVVFRFEDIVGITDSLGGVNVVANHSFTQDNYNFIKGKTYNLKGQQSLAYVRHRKSDGAFKRDERQRQVLKQIVKKMVLNPHLAFKIMTNLDMRYNFFKLLPSMLVLLNPNNISQYTIEGNGTMKKGVYYFIPDNKSLNKAKWAFFTI